MSIFTDIEDRISAGSKLADAVRLWINGMPDAGKCPQDIWDALQEWDSVRDRTT